MKEILTREKAYEKVKSNRYYIKQKIVNPCQKSQCTFKQIGCNQKKVLAVFYEKLAIKTARFNSFGNSG